MVLSNKQAKILKMINENHLKGYKVKADKFGISIATVNEMIYVPSHIENQIQFIINRLKL